MLESFLNKKVLITQIKSETKLIKRKQATLIGLGLRGVNTTSQLLATKDVLGMLKKANHLVKVSINS